MENIGKKNFSNKKRPGFSEISADFAGFCDVLQRVAGRCSVHAVLQCVECCDVLQCAFAEYYDVLQRVAVRCSGHFVLQYVECCDVL